MTNNNSIMPGFEAQVSEMLAGSRCAGCPVMLGLVDTAVRLDHGITWSQRSYNDASLPETALKSVITPGDLSWDEKREMREINHGFSRIFGLTPKEFVETLDSPPAPEDIREVAVSMVKNIPENNRQAGEELVEEIGAMLSSCPNTRKKRVTCALDK